MLMFPSSAYLIIPPFQKRLGRLTGQIPDIHFSLMFHYTLATTCLLSIGYHVFPVNFLLSGMRRIGSYHPGLPRSGKIRKQSTIYRPLSPEQFPIQYTSTSRFSSGFASRTVQLQKASQVKIWCTEGCTVLLRCLSSSHSVVRLCNVLRPCSHYPAKPVQTSPEMGILSLSVRSES
jgi:hypothetical protein